MKRTAFIFAIIILFSACSTPKLAFRPGVQTNQLGIYLEDNKYVPEQIQTKFSNELDEYIAEYNSTSKSNFKVHRSEMPDGEEQLNLKLESTKLVTGGQQAAAVAVSAVGLSLPFVMIAAGSQFYLFFYYFPKDISIFKTSLSTDISDPNITSLNKTHYNSGFLRSEQKQIEKHTAKFDRFMKTIMHELEKDYSKKSSPKYHAKKD